MFRSEFTSSQHWSIRTWPKLHAKRSRVLRRDFSIVWIHTLLTPSCTFEQFKAALEENTSIRHWKTMCCYRATSPSTSTTLEAPTIRTQYSIWIDSGWQRRQSSTAVNPTYIDRYRGRDYDVTKPRIAVYKHNWKEHQNTKIVVI